MVGILPNQVSKLAQKLNPLATMFLNSTVIKIWLSLKICLFLVTTVAHAQMRQPVKWNFSSTPLEGSLVEVVFTATVDEDWHIYSQLVKEGGPLPTTFTFEPSTEYALIDKVKESSIAIEKFDQTFMMPVSWFEKTAVFVQVIKLKGLTAVIKGKVEFMACSEYECLLPESKEFRIEVKAGERENRMQETPIPQTEGKKKNQTSIVNDTAKIEAFKII